MCGRFGFTKPKEQIMKRFNLDRAPDNFPVLYNISPQQNVPAVLNTFPNQLAFIKWNLVPSWSKEPKTSYSMYNAKAETILEKQSYSRLIKSKRCLIISDGFYEWKKAGDKKIPYRIILKNEEPFAFAGIWDTWGEGKDQFYSCCIITCSPNKLVSGIHDRMPVILDPEDEIKWLQDTPINFVLSMLRAYPAEKMDAYPVSTLVNNAANNSPEIIKRTT